MSDYATSDSDSSGTTFEYLEVEIENNNNTGSTSDDEEDVVVGDACIVPYMYEPLPQPQPNNNNPQLQMVVDGGDDNDDVIVDRFNNTDWCTCHHCQIMPHGQNVCCREIPNISAKLQADIEEPFPECITEHPGFLALCTNHWVLEVAWLQYRQQYDDPIEGPYHKKSTCCL
ncbi:uncharacterized protein LOC144445395 [Glandiceps talaboti]